MATLATATLTLAIYYIYSPGIRCLLNGERVQEASIHVIEVGPTRTDGARLGRPTSAFGASLRL
eukprot:scaffold33381_cov52-Phaeocystis_antarctica.AAC.2